MKNKILWLDDLRDPVRHGFPNAYWAKNYDEAISAMSNYQFAGASLDHDLGACADCERKGTHIGDMLTPETTFYGHCPHAKSGYDVICWMEEHNYWPEFGVRVHSANPVGRGRMEQVIRAHYGRNF